MTLVEINEMYNTNPVFKEYVDKYSKAHGILFTEYALKCLVVKNYAEYLKGAKK